MFTTLKVLKLFHDGGRYHIETSPLILLGKSMDWFLYDNDLPHERFREEVSKGLILP